MAKDNKKIAQNVLTNIGGETNVVSLVHCATRLRFVIKDKSKADIAKLKQVEGVITVVESGGQTQVVIGNNVPEVYKEIMENSSISNQSDGDSSGGGSKNLLNVLIDVISSIFTPFIWALAGTGLLKGLLTTLVVCGALKEAQGTYQILWAAADSVFYFLPMILAVTASKKFKADTFLSLALAGTLLYPALGPYLAPLDPSAPVLTFLTIKVMPFSYANSVIPIILAVYILGYVERFFKKLFPDTVKNIFTPCIVLVIMVPLTLLVIGPIGSVVGSWLSDGYNFIYGLNPIIAAILIAGLWQVLVIFGLHWSFIPLMYANYAKFGFDTFSAAIMPAILAQTGACLAVMLKAKGEDLKTLSASSLITSLFGITEPAIYGVTLKLKKPFIAASISAGVAGAIIGFAGAKIHALGGVPSLLTLPAYIDKNVGITSTFYFVLIAVALAFVLSFILTYILGFNEIIPETVNSDSNAQQKVASELAKKIEIFSPLKGEVVSLDKVNDAVFSSGALGKGVAILPKEGKLYAPIDATVTAIYATKHAIGLTSDEGVELLIHIGIDTVQLEGKYFQTKVEQEAKVKKGDLLMEFDIEKITKAGFEVVTPITVSNSDDYLDVVAVKNNTVIVNDQILTIL